MTAPAPLPAYEWDAVPAVNVVVHGRPAPKGSKDPVGFRRGKNGRLVTVMAESSPYLDAWMDAVTLIVRQALARGRARKALGPVYAHVVFTMPKPKTAPKRKRTYPAVYPDVDKLARSTFDAITKATAWEDDSRVIEAHHVKTYPGEHPDALDKPGALIRLYTLAQPVPERNTA
ncbi:RusA family crossover junction endodeoxyribonuclease [Streptomyces cavernae]|uniref:RusA family crossover junction endodeoxyribonuclease n=1 Tax=Streptomyces cavernae TaxID=2259034 RepID=UPI000FEBCF3F|nr:RusA family crossover junction endodeoxyribonuclease [Streptomyces cavernae]